MDVLESPAGHTVFFQQQRFLPVPCQIAGTNQTGYTASYHNVFILPTQGELAYKTKAKTIRGKQSQLAKKVKRNPLPVGIRIDLINKAFPKLQHGHILRTKRGNIEYIYYLMRRLKPNIDLNKIDVFCGPDKYEEYLNQLKNIKEKEEFKDKDITIKKYDVGTRDIISATKLRDAIVNVDKKEGFKTYKELSAPPLSDIKTFEKLRTIMGRIQKIKLENKILNLLKSLKEEI